MVSRKRAVSFIFAASFVVLGISSNGSAKPQPGDPDRLLEPAGVAHAPTMVAARPAHADALMAPRGMSAFDDRPLVRAPNHPDGLMEPIATASAQPQHRRVRSHR